MSAVEIFTVLPSRFPEKISDLDAENFESHVFEGLSESYEKTYLCKQEQEEQTG